ncbi:MAG: class II D-tagatose-bisphosphate aldolase, non-catalytic subunit [Desulfobacterales bacterium]
MPETTISKDPIVTDRLTRLRYDHLTGRIGGVTAVCSAHRTVLEAAIEQAAADGNVLLVEATANQVNQFGGYTGMRPAEFVTFVQSLAAAAEYPVEKVLIGGDHLGPHPWRKAPAVQAMNRAIELVRECVSAGFCKIHLDTGLACGDDPGSHLPKEITAERAAVLCQAAEAAADRQPASRPRPLYVIGAEVPPPGGALEDPAQLKVTTDVEVARTIAVTARYFRSVGLDAAWERVMAVVVQPGVDFGDTRVARYQSEKAAALSASHATLPGIMTYEIHATDYQTPEALAKMVRDHFPLLKAGPCLTNAYREALFALSHIETDWLTGKHGVRLSGLREVLETAMLSHPDHWRSYYRGSAADLKFLRHYSCRDRIRYYWDFPIVRQAVDQLLVNLDRSIPLMLLNQYFPDLYPAIQSGELHPIPKSLTRQRIRSALAPYSAACHSPL